MVNLTRQQAVIEFNRTWSLDSWRTYISGYRKLHPHETPIKSSSEAQTRC